MSSPAPCGGLAEIGQIAITVADVPRAKAFYGGVLGLKFLFDGGPNLAFYAAGGVRLMLTTPQGAGEPGKNSILYFKSGDIGADHAALLGRGARELRKPHRVAKMPAYELWLSAIADPEGNIIELMEERKHPPS